MAKKYMTIYLDEDVDNTLKKMKKLGFTQSEIIELGIPLAVKKIFQLVEKVHSKNGRSKLMDIAAGGSTIYHKGEYP